ncbi:MAG: hypothetical protein Q7T81_05335 [Pseudolabrys sp.]|nr:hypothetical protein [Pseudolabrys sp.]
MIEDLGGPTEVSVACRQLVQRAAVLGAFVEDFETRWLKGEGIAVDEYMVAVNAQRRVLVTLGLKRVARDITPLADYLRRKSDSRHTEADG